MGDVVGGDVGSLWQPRLNHRLQDLHRRAAALTQHCWARFDEGQLSTGIELQDDLQERNRALAVGVQKAEVARSAKAFRQHVLQNQPEEFCARQTAQFALFGSAVLISKANVAALMAEYVLLADHAAIQIATEIDQRFFARSDGFAIDDPVFWVALRERESSRFDGV